MRGLVPILKTEAGRLRLIWRVLLFVFLFSGFLLLSSVVPAGGLLGQTLAVLLSALLAGWILLGLEGRGTGALGFYLAPAALAEASLGLGTGVVVALAAVVGIALFGGLSWVSEPGSYAQVFRVGASALWMFAVPAAAEEALLRGYLLQSLAEGWGGLKALWTTSVVFAALHLGNPGIGLLALGNIVLAGLFLGVIYLKTASLWWASGAHLGWNWAHGFLADLPVSGLDLVDTPKIEARAAGAPWISGGAFGPEASVAATIVLALATLWLWKASWLGPGRRAIETRPLILAQESGRRISDQRRKS